MDLAFLGLGSNVGDRLKNIVKAVEYISERCRILKISTVYESEPWGVKEQDRFLNCVVEVKTSLSPFELLKFVKEVEKRVGRKERFRWGPREIDIDILLYGNAVIKTEELTIPHKHMLERDFVVFPLLEIEEDVIDPISRKPVREVHKVRKNNLKPFCCVLYK